VLAWNTGAERLYGHRAQDMVGHSLAATLPPANLEKAKTLLARVLGGESFELPEVEGVHRDGHPVWVSISIAPLRDEHDRIAGASIISRGIDAEKRTRDELIAAREQFAAAFENAPIGMALIGPDGRFQQVNPAFCEPLDRSAVSLLGTSVQAVTHPDDVDADTEHAGAALAGRSTRYELEKRYLRADGSTVWASVKVSLVRDGAGRRSTSSRRCRT